MDEVDEIRRQIGALRGIFSKPQWDLLDHIVNLTLAKRFDELAEKDIKAALGWADGVVRTTAFDLRRELDEYYKGPGAHWRWRITVPKGKYRAAFEQVPAVAVRNWRKPAALVVIGVGIGLVVGVGLGVLLGRRSLGDPERYSAVLRGFSPAWLAPQHTAGILVYRLVSPDSPLPPRIDWYRFDTQDANRAGSELPVGSPTPPLESKRIIVGEPTDKWNLKKQLHFQSTLTAAPEAWTGFFFWSQWLDQTPRATWSFSAESDLALILYAKKRDVLEIGLRDGTAINAECKLAIRVQAGWAGYRLRLADFQAGAHQVDSRLLELLIITHSRKRGSASENTFEIALVTTIPPGKTANN